VCRGALATPGEKKRRVAGRRRGGARRHARLATTHHGKSRSPNFANEGSNLVRRSPVGGGGTPSMCVGEASRPFDERCAVAMRPLLRLALTRWGFSATWQRRRRQGPATCRAFDESRDRIAVQAPAAPPRSPPKHLRIAKKKRHSVQPLEIRRIRNLRRA